MRTLMRSLEEKKKEEEEIKKKKKKQEKKKQQVHQKAGRLAQTDDDNLKAFLKRDRVILISE